MHETNRIFRYEFRKLGIRHNHLGIFGNPKTWLRDELKYQPGILARPTTWTFPGKLEYLPPLFHSMDQGFYYLTAFLLDDGAGFDDPTTAKSNVLNRVLSIGSLRRETKQFLFDKGGLYTSLLDGTEKAISPSLLPCWLFTKDQGKGVFELLYRSLNERQSGMSLVFEYWFRDPMAEARKARRSSRIFQHIFFSVVGVFHTLCRTLPCLILVPNTPQQGQVLQRSCPTDTLGNSVAILHRVWEDLLDSYPNIPAQSSWHWHGALPARSMSLIELALTAGYPITSRRLFFDGRFRSWPSLYHPDSDGGYHNPIECTDPTICAKLYHSQISQDHERHFIMQPLLNSVLTRVPPHKPRILDILVFNEFDLLRPGSREYNRLYQLGYRHSIMHSVEVLFLMLLVILLSIVGVIAIFVKVGSRFNATAISCLVILVVVPISLILAGLGCFVYWNARLAAQGGNRLFGTGKPYKGYSMQELGQALGRSLRMTARSNIRRRREEGEGSEIQLT